MELESQHTPDGRWKNHTSHGVPVCVQMEGPLVSRREFFYKKAGIADKVRARFYDTPHEFNRNMQAEAWEWLRRWV